MDLRDQLAEERTLLAWIRTGLALMGFGFAVARFGAAAQPKWLSAGLGTVLIGAGVMVNLLSTQRYRHLTTSRNAAALALFVASVGVALAIYVTRM
jgi:putative membrane protein